jgi:hypothetical protein
LQSPRECGSVCGPVCLDVVNGVRENLGIAVGRAKIELFYVSPSAIESISMGKTVGGIVAHDRQPMTLDQSFVLHGKLHNQSAFGS